MKRGRGKQKAPKKPYTPRKKGAVVGPAPKPPRKPYTPHKKDVVAAGVTAAAALEQKQTLQQVLIHALCHPFLAFKLQRDAP